MEIVLEASTQEKETYLRPIHLEMPLEKFDSLLARRFVLLSLSDEVNHIQSVMDIHGIIEELSSTNLGSRTMQKLLSTASSAEIDSLLEVLDDRLERLAVDGYGNYVFQKLL